MIGIWWPLVHAGQTGALAVFVAFATLYPTATVVLNVLASWGAAILVAVYTLVGVCAFLAGLVQVSLLTGGDPTIQEGLELQVIAAVVIGGASLSGGTGSIGGTLLGVLVMEVIRTGSSLIGWPTWVQQIVTGAIIVAAVALDRVRHRRQA